MPRSTLPWIQADPGDQCPCCGDGRLRVYSKRTGKLLAVRYLQCDVCSTRRRVLRPSDDTPPRSAALPARGLHRLLNALRRTLRARKIDPMDLDLAIEYALEFLKKVAEATPSEVDDAAVILLRAIHRDPTLRGWFGEKVELPAGALAMEATPDEEVVLALQANALNWTTVLAHLPEVIRLVQDVLAILRRRQAA